jgi:hypothetical protein
MKRVTVAFLAALALAAAISPAVSSAAGNAPAQQHECPFAAAADV